MEFVDLLEKALKLIRLEQAKVPNTFNLKLAFYIDHAAMIEIKYDLDPQSSLVANGFVYSDILFGFPVHPVLETKEGVKPPILTVVNLTDPSVLGENNE